MVKGFHTKASLARTACELLGRNGFHGTGLNELIAASGAPRGSLYYHFPGGKAEIVAAGLEIARAQTATLLRHAFAGERPLQEKVVTLFGQLVSSMNEDLPSYGCPVAAVALDNFGDDDSIRTQCESIYATSNPAVLLEAASSLANILCSPGDRHEILPGQIPSTPR